MFRNTASMYPFTLFKKVRNKFPETAIYRAKGPLTHVVIDNMNRIELPKKRSKKSRTIYHNKIR